MRRVTVASLLMMVFLLGGCGDETDKPYLEFVGGGFIFNYRIGEAFYGFVAKPLRDIPEGTEIVAEFEDPAGGPPLKIKQPAKPHMLQYMFRTPGVKGIVKDRPYTVTVRLVTAGESTPLAVYTKQYSSNINQSDVPDTALTIGPGYHPNPALFDAKSNSFIIPKYGKN
ncbi:hypothetical protein [Sneathiella sp.]|uniref:hypothetical protein n=1 Tax=Sneathiella sp. TaxID=1964365 RepID=UPI00356A3385